MSYDDWKTTDPDDAAYCRHGHWHGQDCAECDYPIRRDWQRGMSYDDLHKKYGPWGQCECDSCDKYREVERVCDLLAELEA